MNIVAELGEQEDIDNLTFFMMYNVLQLYLVADFENENFK